MTKTAFEFTGSRGLCLAGWIERPETTPRGWAILAHCFTCGKESLAAARIARALALTGIGVLRFDFAGLGRSDGEFADTTFAADVADLMAASSAMSEAGMPPSLLVGHSLGGAAVLAAATNLPEVRAVATIGAPASLDHVLHQFDTGALESIEQNGEAEVSLAGRPFRIRKTFLDDIRRHDIEGITARLHRPLLVMHAPHDDVVGIDHASRIFQSASHPKSFVSLDDADHLVTRRKDADYVATVISAWASRYLLMLHPDLPQMEVAKGVAAAETGAGTFQLSVRSGSHQLIADEPREFGGMDSGLSPYEFISAGLAACTTMTMRLYANRKGIKLRKASVRVEHAKRPGSMPADLFKRFITLEGDLSQEDRDKILSVAERCPVELTLVRGSEIQTALEGVAERDVIEKTVDSF